ncbi:MAG TPA: hypothetical protein VMZ91_05020 [Candidatus Paceibacterota bacterium]|nr:hypothetical protein [Candidatus Paceibacterota bacterium]
MKTIRTRKYIRKIMSEPLFRTKNGGFGDMSTFKTNKTVSQKEFFKKSIASDSVKEYFKDMSKQNRFEFHYSEYYDDGTFFIFDK